MSIILSLAAFHSESGQPGRHAQPARISGKDQVRIFGTHNAARRYQRYCRRLRYQPYSRKEMRRITADYRKVVKHYGPSFSGQYGWASAALSQYDSRFGFAQLEASVKLDHLRPYYQMASHAVHSNPKAIRFSLALEPGQDLLLTGPSNLGLGDPGHGAAISLYQLTADLLTMHPSLGCSRATPWGFSSMRLVPHSSKATDA